MPRMRLWITLLAFLSICVPFTVQAEDDKPDDGVTFDVSAEDWVSTKTARVTVNVNASVSGATAGNARSAMAKALNDLVNIDWRLISFNRGQDQSGMELWSALYEARLPENQLSGLSENAKKLSKPGLQVTISNIDFSPTLEERQAAMAQLRTHIYKMANDQLAQLNATLPGRAYRIALIDFTQDGDTGGSPRMLVRALRSKGNMMAMESDAAAPVPSSEPMERSEKIVMTARVVLAALPPEMPGK